VQRFSDQNIFYFTYIFAGVINRKKPNIKLLYLKVIEHSYRQPAEHYEGAEH